MNAAAKKYTRDFGGAMALYSIAVFLSIPFAKDPAQSQAIRIAAALLPILPSLLALRALITFYRSMDELWQRVHSEAAITAFLITGMVTFSYGFLENAGFPHLPYTLVFPFSIAVWGLALPIISRRYK